MRNLDLRSRQNAPFPSTALIFLGVASFGLFINRLGFYLDDWAVLDTMSEGGRWGALMVWIRRGSLWSRPTAMLQFSLFYLIGGLHPLRYHIMLLALTLLEGCMFFALLDCLLEWRALALLAAACAMMYPNRSMLQLWFSNSPQLTANVLILTSLLAHTQWIRGAGKRRLAASLLLYMAAVLCYESVIFAPLMLGIWRAAREYFAGQGFRSACRQGLRVLLPYALPLAVVVGWQGIGMPLFMHQVNPKSVAMSVTLSHILKVYGAGFECITNRTVHICAKNALAAWGAFSLNLWLCWALVVGFGALSLRCQPAEPGMRRHTIRLSWILATTVFLAGYAPYALSSSYTPQIYGVMSRTNGLGAWGGGLLLASLLVGLGRAAQTAALLLLLGAFTWTNWATNLQWARAWENQQDILSAVSKAARELPPTSVILLDDAPHYVGYAPIFDAFYDFNSALHLTTARSDISGDVIMPSFRFEKDAVVAMGSGTIRARYSYRNLYVYRYSLHSLQRLNGPP